MTMGTWTKKTHAYDTWLHNWAEITLGHIEQKDTCLRHLISQLSWCSHTWNDHGYMDQTDTCHDMNSGVLGAWFFCPCTQSHLQSGTPILLHSADQDMTCSYWNFRNLFTENLDQTLGVLEMGSMSKCIFNHVFLDNVQRHCKTTFALKMPNDIAKQVLLW